MLQLRCSAQNYDWGRQADNSEVAKLARANGSSIDESKPFAELWMGAHPNCPSKVKSTGESLQACLDKHPQLLGSTVQKHFGNQLPFLFKVLSVAKALSIQSHPDKQLAQRLHREHPKLYADPNHKPEMALALSDFEALCGFASTAELQERLRRVPELAALVGAERVAAIMALGTAPAAGEEEEKQAKQALKAAFTALMTSDQAAVTAAVRSLVTRLSAAAASSSGEGLTEHEALALRLNQQFPDDVGLMSAFFLNLVRLPPGSAIYLAANEPHAYLSGELVELMAASDNVIRAGLTPKFKHADVLCESLTYRQGLPEVLIGSPAVPGITVYQPPFEEFEIHRLECDSSETGSDYGSANSSPSAVAASAAASDAFQDQPRMTLPASEGPRILLVQSGQVEAEVLGHLPAELETVPELERGAVLGRGSIVLIPAGVELALRRAEGLVGWIAAVNATCFRLQDARQTAAPAVAAGKAARRAAEEEVPAAPALAVAAL